MTHLICSARGQGRRATRVCRLQAAPVGAVDHPDEAVRRFEVVAPVGAQRFLTANVPDVQAIPGVITQILTQLGGIEPTSTAF